MRQVKRRWPGRTTVTSSDIIPTAQRSPFALQRTRWVTQESSVVICETARGFEWPATLSAPRSTGPRAPQRYSSVACHVTDVTPRCCVCVSLLMGHRQVVDPVEVSLMAIIGVLSVPLRQPSSASFRCWQTRTADPADSNDPRCGRWPPASAVQPPPSSYVRDNIGIEVLRGRCARAAAGQQGRQFTRPRLQIALLRPPVRRRSALCAGRHYRAPGSTALTGSRVVLPAAYWVRQTDAESLYNDVAWPRHSTTGWNTGFGSSGSSRRWTHSPAALMWTFAAAPRHSPRCGRQCSVIRHAFRSRRGPCLGETVMFGFGLGDKQPLGPLARQRRSGRQAGIHQPLCERIPPPSLAIGATQNTHTPYLTVGDAQPSMIGQLTKSFVAPTTFSC